MLPKELISILETVIPIRSPKESISTSVNLAEVLVPIIKSDLLIAKFDSYNFKRLYYITYNIAFTSNSKEYTIYTNTSYLIALGDRTFIKDYIPSKIRYILSPIFIYSLRNRIYQSNKFVIVKYYIRTKSAIDRKPIIAILTIEIYLVNNLYINILISINILIP